MSANLLERVTPTVRVSGGSMAVDAQGDAVAAFNTAFRRKGEGEANAELFALAPDHALFASAVAADKAEMMGGRIHVVGANPAWSEVKIDAAGCPALTPELREALRRAIGIEAANG